MNHLFLRSGCRISLLTVVLLLLFGTTVQAQEFPESHERFLTSNSYRALQGDVHPLVVAPPATSLRMAGVGLNVGPNVQMNDPQLAPPDGLIGRSETTIASDPSGLFLLSAWNDADGFCGPPFGAACTPPPTPGGSGYATSIDGGATWTDQGAAYVFTAPDFDGDARDVITRGDPWLATGGPGEQTYFFANLGVFYDGPYSPAQGFGASAGVTVHTGRFQDEVFSFNNAVLIQSPNFPDDFLDKESIAAGHNRMTRNMATVAVTNFQEVADIPYFGFGTIETYTSTDRGKSFPTRGIVQADETISVPDNTGILNQGADVAIAGDGAIYVVWERGRFAPFFGQDDAGVWPQIVFARSDDGGATYSSRVVVSDISSASLFPPPGYNRPQHNDFPRMALAETGPYQGRIYVTYHDSRVANGGTQAVTGGFGDPDADVYVRSSDDGGDTWSDPVLVAGDGDGKIQFWPVVSSDPNGRVSVTYYESDPSTCLVDLYFADSQDGGATFSTPVPVTSVPSNWCNAFSNIRPNFGDYNSHVSKANRVMVTWADGRSGIPDAYFAALRPPEEEAVVATATFSTAAMLDQNYPNPFNPETALRFELPEASDVQLVVFDVIGRQVAVLADGKMPAGRHSVTFDARGLPSGLYLARLTTPQGVVTRTMQLVK